MVKMLLSFSFVIVAGMADDFVDIAILMIIYCVIACLCGQKISELLAFIRPFRFLLLFTCVIQLFITPLGQWIVPNHESIARAIFYTLRITLIIGFSCIFTVITPMIDIVRVFFLLFKPLRIVHISPADTALSMLIALRFIPLLFSEGEKIMDSQRLKGILPDRGKKAPLAQLIKSSISLIIPLFARTFHYADQIAITLRYRRSDSLFFRLSLPIGRDYLVGIFILILSVGVGIVTQIS